MSDTAAAGLGELDFHGHDRAINNLPKKANLRLFIIKA